MLTAKLQRLFRQSKTMHSNYAIYIGYKPELICSQ